MERYTASARIEDYLQPEAGGEIVGDDPGSQLFSFAVVSPSPIQE